MLNVTHNVTLLTVTLLLTSLLFWRWGCSYSSQCSTVTSFGFSVLNTTDSSGSGSARSVSVRISSAMVTVSRSCKLNSAAQVVTTSADMWEGRACCWGIIVVRLVIDMRNNGWAKWLILKIIWCYNYMKRLWKMQVVLPVAGKCRTVRYHYSNPSIGA